jgi:uncharacterized cupredoxin-like copper-binding protein
MKSIRAPFFLNLTLASLLSAASVYALAQSVTEATPEATASSAAAYIFRSYDSNGDGAISPEEFKDKGGQEQTFTELDTNQDQRLSNDELAKLAARPQSSLFGMRFTLLNH